MTETFELATTSANPASVRGLIRCSVKLFALVEPPSKLPHPDRTSDDHLNLGNEEMSKL